MQFQSIPIIRIFDEERAKEFYLEFLGMTVDWEHRFDADYPIYLQVSKENLILHLSEHSGDCTPGSKVFVNVSDLEALFQDISSRPNKYCKPSIEQAAWGGSCFTVTDPFSNKLLFNQHEISQ